MATMDQILKDTDSILAVKAAAFTGRKSGMAGEDPSSMPGSEKDKPIPEGSEAANKEVADATMGPASTRATDGAGDDSPVTRGHGMDAEAPAENEIKKPLITADANAKQAEMANDLLQHIQGWQQKRAAAAKTGGSDPQKAAESQGTPGEGVEKTDTQPPTPDREKHSIPGGEGGAGGGGSATGTKPTGAPDTDSAGKQAAGGFDMLLTQEVLAKMAAIALSYDEGVEFMTGMLEKFSDDQAAAMIMNTLQEQNDAYEKAAAAQRGYADGMQAVNAFIAQKAAECSGGGASHPTKKPMEEEEEKPAKKAAAPTPAGPTPEDLWKLGQEMAGASVGDIMGSLPDESGAPMGGPEQGASPDDVAAALDILVQQGELQPEEAAEILQFVEGGGGGMGGDGMVGAGAPGMGGDPIASMMGGGEAAPPAPEGGEAPPAQGGGEPPPPPPPSGGGEGGGEGGGSAEKKDEGGSSEKKDEGGSSEEKKEDE